MLTAENRTHAHHFWLPPPRAHGSGFIVVVPSALQMELGAKGLGDRTSFER